MSLADMYFICFLVGFGFTVLAALSWTHYVHLPGVHHGHHASPHGSVLSFGNVAAFLTWFGGAGYLLTRFSGIWLWFAFLLAVVAGILGGVIVFAISLKL